MNNFEKNLKEILTEDENIIIDENQLSFLKQKVKENAPKTKHNCKMYLVVACFAVILCIGVILGFSLSKSQSFYSDSYGCRMSDINQSDIDTFLPNGLQLPDNIIQSSYSLSKSSVYVSEDTNKQMAILVKYSGLQSTYDVIYIRISTDKSFRFSDADSYTRDANVTTSGKFKIYEKNYSNIENHLYRCIECNDYKIYISDNADDEALIDSIVAYFIAQNA
jgi:hypothetical protein